MAKDKNMYVCENCGQDSAKWIGKCPACGQWNTYKEIKVADTQKKVAATSAAASAGRQLRENKVLRLKDISAHDDPRINMHDDELNRVLGGGLVPGSIVLLGGEPGIGKSTLTLQTMLNLSSPTPNTQHPTPNTQHPTPITQHPTCTSSVAHGKRFQA